LPTLQRVDLKEKATALARRLKINSAHWRVRRAERMGAIRCVQYAGLWEAYWESKQAA